MASSKSTCLYIVIQSLGRWWVDCEGRAHGPFSSREMAGRSAVEIARIFGESGRPWEVLSRDTQGRYQVIADSRNYARDVTDGFSPSSPGGQAE